jgi:hypothetical protein
MTFARILFNGREIGKVTTEAELVAFLERVRAGFHAPNPLFEFEHEKGNTLYFGISPAGNHVAYVDASPEPPILFLSK